MAPAFAPSAPARTRAATMSTPAVRLAARARQAAAEGRSSRKRRKTEKAMASQAVTAVPAVPEIAEKVLKAERKMSDDLEELSFDEPVTHVYNPLVYAWEAHKWYVQQFANSKKEILLVGMNPGPWGMAQTGVPFGEISAVREWMKMPTSMKIQRPERENVHRPVLGLDCERSEVSGKRFWMEWAREQYSLETFFERFYVHNYCPLMFLQENGRNRTPAQLRAMERKMLVDICDEGLRQVVLAIQPKVVCGVGGFATERCRVALRQEVEKGLLVESVLHPSPASPLANKGWAKKAEETMRELVKKVATVEDFWASTDSSSLWEGR